MTLDGHTFHTTLGRQTKIVLCITGNDEGMLRLQKTAKRPEIAPRASAWRKSPMFRRKFAKGSWSRVLRLSRGRLKWAITERLRGIFTRHFSYFYTF
jgi:hypothetical protein